MHTTKTSKALLFEKKQKVSSREITRKCQISKSSVAWIGDTCSGMSGHLKNYNFVQRGHWKPFAFICLRNDIVWHHLMLPTFWLHNVMVLSSIKSLWNLKICPLISISSHLTQVEMNNFIAGKNLILSSANMVLTFHLQNCFKVNSSTLNRVRTVAFTARVMTWLIHLWNNFEKIS